MKTLLKATVDATQRPRPDLVIAAAKKLKSASKL